MCTVPSIIISVLLILTKCLLDEWLKRNNYYCSRKHSYEKESWYIGDNFWVNVVYVTKFIVLFMLSNWKICRGEEGNIIDQTGSILIIHFFEMFGWEKRRKKEENLASICQGGVWGVPPVVLSQGGVAPIHCDTATTQRKTFPEIWRLLRSIA
jgi:hypothetical protein